MCLVSLELRGGHQILESGVSYSGLSAAIYVMGIMDEQPELLTSDTFPQSPLLCFWYRLTQGKVT